MCRFFEVSRSGYYAWRKRRDRLDRDMPMSKLIAQCQQETKETYGYRRVRLWLLQKHCLVVNHKAVLRVMRKYGLLSSIRRPRPLYQRQQRMNIYENKLNRDFHADRPNQKWVTDISYIHTGEGTLYLSAIKDLYDDFIVAYDMGTIQDNALVYRTIQKAKKEVADGLILHSDQGFQYTSHGYLNLTKQYGILPSMSRAATPLDNAPAENFFGILKTECIYRQKIQTIHQARHLIDQYIHFYNFERIKTKNGHTPFQIRSGGRVILSYPTTGRFLPVYFHGSGLL
ncbi:IS3 family transposase [Sporomusa sphaeroides]